MTRFHEFVSPATAVTLSLPALSPLCMAGIWWRKAHLTALPLNSQMSGQAVADSAAEELNCPLKCLEHPWAIHGWCFPCWHVGSMAWYGSPIRHFDSPIRSIRRFVSISLFERGNAIRLLCGDLPLGSPGKTGCDTCCFKFSAVYPRAMRSWLGPYRCFGLPDKARNSARVITVTFGSATYYRPLAVRRQRGSPQRKSTTASRFRKRLLHRARMLKRRGGTCLQPTICSIAMVTMVGWTWLKQIFSVTGH